MVDLADITANLIGADDFLAVIKIVLVIAEVIYGFFAFIVVRQVALMNKSFQTDTGPFFTSLAYLHFFAVVTVFILTLIVF